MKIAWNSEFVLCDTTFGLMSHAFELISNAIHELYLLCSLKLEEFQWMFCKMGRRKKEMWVWKKITTRYYENMNSEQVLQYTNVCECWMPVVKNCSGVEILIGISVNCERYEFRPDVEKKSTRKLQTPSKRNGFIYFVESLAFVSFYSVTNRP